MKKITSLLVVCFLLAVGTNLWAQSFASGSGTALDPYVISTVAHMESMHTADYTNPVYYKLTADIDMTGVNWIPVNLDPYPNHIHFDGNGHIISNLSVIGTPYASLFGVLLGSCKNLGVINATIESTGGGGIIAGYVGLKGPNKPTGIISNCYTTGTVSGTDAVGGIAGNIGKPNGEEFSIVRNCYSTADVISTNTTGNSRVGGVVGIVYDRGVLENSYATGKVTSSNFGAGGVAGWADANLKGVVAMNSSVNNLVSGKLGRICGNMGAIDGAIAQGVNCWGYEGVVLDDAGYIIPDGDLVKGEVSTRNTPYDGETKSLEFLSNAMNYFQDLDWDFASATNIWAQDMSNGKPIFQWQFDRGDYADLDGHTTSINENFLESTNILFKNGALTINSENQISGVQIYNTAGQLVYSTISMNTNEATIQLEQNKVFVVSVLVDGKWNSTKILSK